MTRSWREEREHLPLKLIVQHWHRHILVKYYHPETDIETQGDHPEQWSRTVVTCPLPRVQIVTVTDRGGHWSETY